MISESMSQQNKNMYPRLRQNRVIKERARAIIQTLPYKDIPRKIRIGLIQYVVFWLNCIPKSGQEHSPRDLVFGEQKINYETTCRLPFGAYAQVHDDLDVTNTMQSRTTGAISLGATGNVQGTYRFFNLHTGEVIVRRKWTELPIPHEAIVRLQDFTYDEIDTRYVDHEDELDQNEQSNENTTKDHNTEGDTTEQSSGEQQLREPEPEKVGQENANDQEEQDDDASHNAMMETELQNQNDMETSEPQGYHLRPNRERSYSHKFSFLSVKAGSNKWGDKAKEAVQDELLMFQQIEVFKFVPNPTEEQKQQAL